MRKAPLIILAVSLFLLTGCAQTIEEITADDSHVDEQVTVKGTVQGVLKIGDVSGYTLVDKNDDKILVSSERLPAEGDTVTVKGTLRELPLGLGHYIES